MAQSAEGNLSGQKTESQSCLINGHDNFVDKHRTSPHVVCTFRRLMSRLQFPACEAPRQSVESPHGIGAPHPLNEQSQLWHDLGPTLPAALTQRSPVVPKSLLLPKCDRSRLDKEQCFAPLRSTLSENAPEQPIRRCGAWSLPLLTDTRTADVAGRRFPAAARAGTEAWRRGMKTQSRGCKP